MSQHCRPKVRTTFRRSRKVAGNKAHLINYPDPALIWKVVMNWKRAQQKTQNNAVLKEKAS